MNSAYIKQGDATSGISGFTLKVIAVVTMLIDHTAATILERAIYGNNFDTFVTPDNMQFWVTVYLWMRIIGRMAFPIYCFLLVEGFTHTRNRWKYALRLFLFALVSELPFDLAFQKSYWDMSYNNVFFTLLLGLLTIMEIDWICKKSLFGDGIGGKAFKAVDILLTLGVMMWIAENLLHTDYGASGIVAIVLIFLLYKSRNIAFGAAVVSLGVLSSVLEFAALLMLLPIKAYNGTRGKNIKYFFYIFYPAHLAILVGICYLMGLK